LKKKYIYKLIAKVIGGLILITLVALIGWIAFLFYVFNSWRDEIWSEKNRIIVNEYFSPDSSKKIGLYKYDSGALGYTAIQMSILYTDGAYPIGGNILQINRIPPEVNWVTDDSVVVILDTSNTPGFEIKENCIIDGVKFKFFIN